MFDSSKIQPYISFSALREWMAEADALGELKTVLGASWQQEIGLATDVVVPPDDGPAVLFDEVPGCPKGFRLLINCFAGKRRARLLRIVSNSTSWAKKWFASMPYKGSPRSAGTIWTSRL